MRHIFERLAECPTEAHTMPRAQLIAALQWNDPNGCYTDAAMRTEFDRVATDDELRCALLCQVIDSIPRS